MMNRISDHLNEDQLIRLVIDPTDLPRSVRNHLDECARCRADKIQFEQELAAFGRMAQTFAPEPRQKKYPSQQASARFWRLMPFSTGWRRLAWAGGVAIILLMCGVLHQITMNSSVDPLNMLTVAEIIGEQPFVADMIPSEDSDLTEIMKQMAYDTNGYLDDEFVEFVAPFEVDLDSV